MSDDYKDAAAKLHGLLNGAAESAERAMAPAKPVQATVSNVTAEGVYVKTDGDDTAKGPFPATIKVNVGDRVGIAQVGGTWTVNDNFTNPAADQETVDEAWDMADAAQAAAGEASSAASAARASASAASTAAATADAKAVQAGTAAANAQSSADAAASAAAMADSKATQAATAAANAASAAATADAKAVQAATAAANAQRDATTANTAANGALTGLSTVQDVIGVLNWAAENAEFALTSDTSIVPGKVYWSRSGASPDYTYTPIANPVESGLSSYYEVSSVDSAMGDYISSHLALTDSGLYVMQDGNGYRLKLNANGWYIIDPRGVVVNQATGEGSDIGYVDDFHTHITDRSISLRKDDSDLFEVKSDGTTTEIATGEGRLYSVPLNKYFYILNAQNSTVVDILLYSDNFNYQSDLLDSGWVVKPLNASTSSSSSMSTQSTAPAPGPDPGPSGNVTPCDVYQYGKVVYHVESSSVVKDASSNVLTGWTAHAGTILSPQSTETSEPNSGMNFWVNKDFARMQADCGLLDLIETDLNVDGNADVNGDRLTTTGGRVTGYPTYGSGHLRLFANGIAFKDPYNSSSSNGNSDFGWIRMVEETANSGYLEIATGDDGNEPIYVRQYNTSNAVAREAILLGTDGNTNFPGTIKQNGTAVSLNGHTHNYAGSSSAGGSANSAVMLDGFASRATSMGWGNQTGTVITSFNDSTGGSIGWRRDNPSGGQMSMIIDGTVYVDEGRYSVLNTNNYSSYALPTSGGTLSGNLLINSIDGSWIEGVRINRAPSGWCGVILGGANGSTSGKQDYLWWIGSGPTETYSRKLFVQHYGSAGNTYFFAESGADSGPVGLHVGGKMQFRTVLYNNASGTSSNITLSSSAANFNHMRIYWYDTGMGRNSLDIYDPNGKTFNAMAAEVNRTSGTKFWLDTQFYQINGTSMSYQSGRWGQFWCNGTGSGVSSTDAIRIVRVEGWNE